MDFYNAEGPHLAIRAGGSGLASPVNAGLNFSQQLSIVLPCYLCVKYCNSVHINFYPKVNCYVI